MKSVVVIALVAVGVGVAIELALRWVLGLGNPPLYVADDRTGYRLAPGQALRRFGNRIEVNEYSMRGGPLAAAGSTLRILLLGDSIANGGWWTDRDDTIAVQLAGLLGRSLPPRVLAHCLPGWNAAATTAAPPIEVLNASANSWGPRNELGYLEKFGDFGAVAIVLLLNTDDLFGFAPNALPVGRDVNYPDRRPPLALLELWQTILPPPRDPELDRPAQESGDVVGANLKAIAQIQARAAASQATFLIALTPLKRELAAQRDYEGKARDRLADLAESLAIDWIDLLPELRSLPPAQAEALYRDTIHFTPEGNALVSRAIARRLTGLLVDRPRS